MCEKKGWGVLFWFFSMRVLSSRAPIILLGVLLLFGGGGYIIIWGRGGPWEFI